MIMNLMVVLLNIESISEWSRLGRLWPIFLRSTYTSNEKRQDRHDLQNFSKDFLFAPTEIILLLF